MNFVFVSRVAYSFLLRVWNSLRIFPILIEGTRMSRVFKLVKYYVVRESL